MFDVIQVLLQFFFSTLQPLIVCFPQPCCCLHNNKYTPADTERVLGHRFTAHLQTDGQVSQLMNMWIFGSGLLWSQAGLFFTSKEVKRSSSWLWRCPVTGRSWELMMSFTCSSDNSRVDSASCRRKIQDTCFLSMFNWKLHWSMIRSLPYSAPTPAADHATTLQHGNVVDGGGWHGDGLNTHKHKHT